MAATPEAPVILLDTHAIVLLALRPDRLSRAATRAIARAETRRGIAIASITLWEIAQLAAARRIVVSGSIEGFLWEIWRRPGLAVLDLNPEIAALAAGLPPDFPADPADRIIAATARVHGLPLVTRDQKLQDSPLLRTVW